VVDLPRIIGGVGDEGDGQAGCGEQRRFDVHDGSFGW